MRIKPTIITLAVLAALTLVTIVAAHVVASGGPCSPRPEPKDSTEP